MSCFAARRAASLFRTGAFPRGPNLGEQIAEVEGHEHVVRDAPASRLHGEINIASAFQHDDARIRGRVMQASYAPQVLVVGAQGGEERHLGSLVREKPHRLFHIRLLVHHKSPGGQQDGQLAAESVVGRDDQDAVIHSCVSVCGGPHG